MSIPKKIHYCWFGHSPLPKNVQICIQSWKRFCPDYEIIQWNETNFDISASSFTEEAYQQKKWAFVSDFARLKIIWEQGGIYLDTDVELIKPLDSLLSLDGFMGFQDSKLVASGLGFGAVARHPVIGFLLEDYTGQPAILEDGTLDLTPCPERNTKRLLSLGLIANGNRQTVNGITILPADYLSPMNWETGVLQITKNTLSIHHYHASWLDKKEKRRLHIRRLLGPPLYEFLRIHLVAPVSRRIRRWRSKK